MTDYDSYTVNNKNPFVRYAHRSRVKIAKNLVTKQLSKSILDFGCGDGHFLLEVSKSSDVDHLIGFEPYMAKKKDATEITIYKTWDEVINHVEINNRIETVVCFEVMEHFSTKSQLANLEKIESIMDEGSSLIISVPIEKGLISLLKNIYRVLVACDKSEDIYTLKNIACSVIGIKTKEMIKIRNKDNYLPHMGFYFNELENLLLQLFTLEQKIFSPFPFLPSSLNSQVFFNLKKKSKQTKSY